MDPRNVRQKGKTVSSGFGQGERSVSVLPPSWTSDLNRIRRSLGPSTSRWSFRRPMGFDLGRKISHAYEQYEPKSPPQRNKGDEFLPPKSSPQRKQMKEIMSQTLRQVCVWANWSGRSMSGHCNSPGNVGIISLMSLFSTNVYVPIYLYIHIYLYNS